MNFNSVRRFIFLLLSSVSSSNVHTHAHCTSTQFFIELWINKLSMNQINCTTYGKSLKQKYETNRRIFFIFYYFFFSFNFSSLFFFLLLFAICLCAALYLLYKKKRQKHKKNKAIRTIWTADSNWICTKYLWCHTEHTHTNTMRWTETTVLHACVCACILYVYVCATPSKNDDATKKLI